MTVKKQDQLAKAKAENAKLKKRVENTRELHKIQSENKRLKARLSPKSKS